MIINAMINDIIVYLLRAFMGIIWVVAVLLTAILLAPVHVLMMLSSHIWQPQNIRY
jgi:hypothetical protein